jgi:hydrophobic/amphiphilic exporter-1 (mainly G- bacteria), HAE1 family
LVDSSKRKGITTSMDKERARKLLEKFAYASPKVIDYDPTGGGGQPFQLNIIGDNQTQLEEVASKVLAALKKETRLVDVDSSYRPGKPEMQVVMDGSLAQSLGVSSRAVGLELRTQVAGATPAKYRINGDEYDIRVRLKENERNLAQNFEGVFVPNSNQKMIKLNQFAKIKEAPGPAAINRQDRSRYIEISADLAKGADQSAVMAEISERLKSGDLKLPAGVRSMYVGQSEDFQELGGAILLAMAFAVMFIYLVLCSLYESFFTPFTIMLTLPLALVGAFVGLYLANESINLFANLGIFLLIGVAAKNSILVVDYAKQLTNQGVDRYEAVIRAGKARLRPILMTSFALIAGTLPLAIGLNEASKQRTSMGVGIIGGTISSTVLTLIAVPAVFILIDRLRELIESRFTKGRK